MHNRLHRPSPFAGSVKTLTLTLAVGTSLLATFLGTPVARASSKPSATKQASSKPATTKPAATKRATTQPPTTKVAAPASAVARPSSVPVRGSLTVFAATSLSASFTDIAAAFELANPAVSVKLNFAGSSTLAAQIQNGAQADVFASADVANMERLQTARLVKGEPTVFTRNTLMMVVGKGNPLRIRTLADLSSPDVFVALGAPGVPVGDYARQVLDRAGVTVVPKTLESNVAAIVNKVALREIDAGIVYVTDVARDDYRTDGIAIPGSQNIITTYPIATLSDSRNSAAATAFTAFTRSPRAQAILAKYKFLPLP